MHYYHYIYCYYSSLDLVMKTPLKYFEFPDEVQHYVYFRIVFS